jgi:microcin C transport system substrate-binding protein
MRRNAAGQPLTIEILNDDVGNDRIINPFIQNLRAIGIDATNRRVDNAEMQLRTRSKDFDMVEDSLGQSYAVGGYAGQVFGSEDADDVFNPMGLANPAIDKLLELGQQAETEGDNIVAISALDRALRSLRFWVPKWFKAEYTLAYYDIYRHPETMPPYALGTLDFWWADTAREAELKASGAIR